MPHHQSRILINDYAGHPFQIQLSRKLAQRGHTVRHCYFSGLNGPQGRLQNEPAAQGHLEIDGIDFGHPHKKYAFLERRADEVRYGQTIAGIIKDWKPNVVISSNMPIEAQSIALKATHRIGAHFIFWLQDILSIAAFQILGRKMPGIGHAVGLYYQHVEQTTLKNSDAVVTITNDFIPPLEHWGVDLSQIAVIENWAPLEDLTPQSKDNSWAHENGLTNEFVFLYAGTLGLKQDPRVLVDLARTFRTPTNQATIAVVTEGAGRDYLETVKAAEALDNLRLYDFQPFDRLSDVLGTSDVLTATLERDAGIFSVPSKVLSYLTVGRPILLSAPNTNLAAKIVKSSGAGLSIDQAQGDDLTAAAQQLFNSATLRQDMAAAGLSYAHRHFDIDRIADRFEEVIVSLGQQTSYLRPAA